MELEKQRLVLVEKSKTEAKALKEKKEKEAKALKVK